MSFILIKNILKTLVVQKDFTKFLVNQIGAKFPTNPNKPFGFYDHNFPEDVLEIKGKQ